MKKFLPYLFLLIVVGVVLFFVLKPKEEHKQRGSILSEPPVTTMRVLEAEITDLVSLVGITAPIMEANVSSETQGVVRSVHLAIGKFVSKGAVLAYIDDVVRKSDLTAAEISYLKAKRDFERDRKFYEQNASSAADLDISRLNLQSAENNLDARTKAFDDTKIKAPFSGMVNTKPIDVGTLVTPGTVITNLVDIRTLKVKVNVSENEAFSLKVGDEVDINFDVYPDKTFVGRIDNIASKADDSHTYPIEIIISNSNDHPLKGGMFARVFFTSVASVKGIAIPREALVGSVKDGYVYIVENNVAKQRKVKIGKETAKLLQVVDGLKEGDVIVKFGQNNLNDGTNVKVVKEETLSESK